MITLRNLRWPDDRPAICALDTSFTTGRVYQVVATGTGFILQYATLAPPLERAFDLRVDVDELPSLDEVLIAEREAQVVGLAALAYEAEDRRAVVRHLYVERAQRGQGIGRALMEAMIDRARQYQARCIWLETQDVNYDAIRFYRWLGFEWCGLDLSLDVRVGSARDETAVFFMRNLA